ncbi:MAG: PilZ domain-containing protein [Acidimicrobiales bacterium]
MTGTKASPEAPQEWRPSGGQLALIEEVGAASDDRCLTGLVVGDDDGRVLIDLGASPRPHRTPAPVVASFFAPDALYRITGTAVANDRSPSLLVLDAESVERVQRRADRRRRAALPVGLGAFDAHRDFVAMKGTTIDVSAGGCRVLTHRPLLHGVEVSVSILTEEHRPVVALAEVVDTHIEAGVYDYRMRFLALAPEDRSRLEDLVNQDEA